MNFVTAFIPGISGAVTVDKDNRSKCKMCKKEVTWGVTHKPAYIPLDNLNGKWNKHICKVPKMDDRLEEFNRQKIRDNWSNK
jgi:hypothetical protein